MCCKTTVDDESPRVNVQVYSLFPIEAIEAELRKLLLNLQIDDGTPARFPCLRKMNKRKSLEESLGVTTKQIVRTYGSAIRRNLSSVKLQHKQRHLQLTLPLALLQHHACV